MKITLRARILHFVYENGEASIGQVLAAVGKHVSATEAIRAYETARKYEKKRGYKATKKQSVNHCIESGRRKVVKAIVKALFYEGKMRRVARGKYAA